MRTAGFSAPLMVTCATPGGLRQALRQDGVGGIVDLRRGQRGRGQRDLHDRRVGRVEFPVERPGRQVGRQIHRRGVDRRLHVVRGAVDVAVDVELDDDRRVADRGGGGDLGHPGDLPQPAFQRRGDGVGHRFGIGAGPRGEHDDGRDVDARQRGDRQEAVGDDAGQHQADRQQDGGDGTVDEGGGEAHRPGCHRRGLCVAPVQAGLGVPPTLAMPMTMAWRTDTMP